MKIIFGMYLDGAIWGRESASLGEVRTGPQGLLGILETRLAVTKPAVHPVRRIDEYMQRMKLIDQETEWFHNSFVVDPWSTARHLLLLRDELVEAGWTSDMPTGESLRLQSLNHLEKVEYPLTPGRADRLREVIGLLEKNNPSYIATIELLEPETMLPPVWQYVMNLLKNQGTFVNIQKESESKELNSNLSNIQAVLQFHESNALLFPQDDSLILLQAENEWDAAEHVALWLASKPEVNQDVTIICGRDTGVLDQVLKMHGLPSLGRSEASRWREIQQVLPLIIANAWTPIDIHRMVELLSLTMPPFPKWICRELLRAITKEPGVNGQAWKAALAVISEKRKKDLTEAKDPRAEERTQELIREIQSLLVEDRYNPDLGIPEGKLWERCQKIIDWFGWRIDQDPMFSEIVSHAREMQRLTIHKGSIPRTTLERMLDTVIGAGSEAEDSLEEAALWHVVDHPGQVVDSTEEILWWGFNEPQSAQLTYWSCQERETLEASSVHAEKSSGFRRRDAFSWQRGMMMAKGRFIAVYIEQENGEESYHHPYWDSVLYAASETAGKPSEDTVKACLIRSCKDLDHIADWSFAGRRNVLTKVEKEPSQEVRSEHHVPASVIPTPDRMSYSQMNSLIGCPMKWSLKYHAGISLSQSQAIPTGNQMIGTFCHKIVELIFLDTGKIWSADAACEEAKRLYDELLPAMASELLLEGNEIEKLRYRSAVSEAVRHLVAAINRLNLKVEKTEARLDARLDDIPFEGFADLLLRDTEGHPYIFDMKWSSSSKYRRLEVEQGLALQLAAYNWMLKSAESGQQAKAGYFMLAQGEIISDNSLLSDDVIVSPNTLEQIWEMGTASMKDTIAQLQSGLIEVKGVKELQKQAKDGKKADKVEEELAKEYSAKGLLYQQPSCNLCDYKGLCNISGGRA